MTGHPQIDHDLTVKGLLDEIERLRATVQAERDARVKLEQLLRCKDQAAQVLLDRLDEANVDYSDLIP